MELVLVDSSVWINVLKGKETGASIYLRKNSGNLVITTCALIMQEVLQGIRHDKSFAEIKQRFDDLFHLPSPDPYLFAVQAAELFRKLRKRGVTIRKANDCMIAYYAIKNDVMLLHDDADFDLIAQYTALKVLRE